MSNTSVTTKIHEPFNAHGDFTSQVAFDRKMCHCIANSRDLRLAQVFHPGCRIDACAGADTVRTRPADAVDVRQRDPYMLVDRDVDPCDSCHFYYRYLIAPRGLNPGVACDADPCI